MNNDEKIEELYQRIFELEGINNKLKEELNKHIKEGIEKENIIKETRDYIKEAIISESTEFYGLIDGEHVLAILEREKQY